MSNLEALGWCAHFSDQLEPSLDPSCVPARVLEDLGGGCRVHTGCSELSARLAGRLRTSDPADRPVAGDWTLVRTGERGDALLVRVLARRTRLARKAAGRGSREQILAANIDRVWIVVSLEEELNPRRLERYFVVVREGGAQPIVLLNKADRCADPDAIVGEARRIARGVPVYAVDALHGNGLDAVRATCKERETIALVGSSGVGKSTLVNALGALAGDAVQRVAVVRAHDGKGRHTTTARRIVFLPGGGMLLDTPGMRELGVLASEPSLDATFSDVEELARGCRFRDCRHETEPGCAVRDALAAGTLDATRIESRRKLEREARHAAAKHDLALRHERTTAWRRIHREMRALEKRRGR